MLWLALACSDAPTFGTTGFRPGDYEGAPIDLSEHFALGINLPWVHYGHDFGKAAGWSHDGLSTAQGEGFADDDLGYLSASHARVVRWFVLCDGRASPEFEDGVVVGLDEHFYDDFDAMLALAEAHDTYVIPVLFDYLWFEEATDSDGTQLGGRAQTVTDDVLRQTLLDQAITPIAERYGDHPRILAWDIINEPEWAMADFGFVADRIENDDMRTFVAEVSQALRLHSEAPITVGSSDLLAMEDYWATSGLDLMQFHWYSEASPDFSGKDMPHANTLLGEFPTADTSLDLSEMLDAAMEAGMAGALPWSLNGADDKTDFEGVRDDYTAWAEAHADLIGLQ